MNKSLFALCLLSAVLGSVISSLVLGPSDAVSQVGAGGPGDSSLVPPAGPLLPPGTQAEPLAGPSVTARGGTQLDELTPEERVNIAVYENVKWSVVNITTKGYRGDRVLFMEVPSEGEGSGSVIDRQGHILTNAHVVEGAQAIQVTLGTAQPGEHKVYDAQLVGQDTSTDVAVIKINAPAQELHPITWGDSDPDRLHVGQRVYALGNPFGLERTLSTGIISSLDRYLPRRHKAGNITQIIQIDASINPGSSGGPLLDTRGRVIGMNTAIASKTGESAGIGFAIPVNTIRRVVPQLVQYGRVTRPEVGIARAYETEQGLLIATITPGGAAERAGLRGPRVVRQRQGPFSYHSVDLSTADLIVAVDGKPVKNAAGFLELIEAKQPGDQVLVTIVRGGRQLQIPVKLDAGN